MLMAVCVDCEMLSGTRLEGHSTDIYSMMETWTSQKICLDTH